MTILIRKAHELGADTLASLNADIQAIHALLTAIICVCGEPFFWSRFKDIAGRE